MKVINSLAEWQQLRAQLASQTIGFVPTMGNLHQGHLSLFKRSQSENQLTVGSIYVNPTQFNISEDFEKYPNTIAADHHQLADLGIDYCLMPSYQDIYQDGYRYRMTEHELSLIMEGKHRPGHFDGVLTVVLKLLNLVQPNRAYFGEKDYQQFQLIRDMAEGLFLPTAIMPCPIARDQHGLALSSRNNRLDANELEQARLFAQLFHQGNSCEEIIGSLVNANINVEYVEEFQNRRYAAVFVGPVRLIDNYSID